MSGIEDRLSWILVEFKEGKLNYPQAVLEIEEAIVKALGINVHFLNKLTQQRKHIEELEQELKMYTNFKKEMKGK